MPRRSNRNSPTRSNRPTTALLCAMAFLIAVSQFRLLHIFQASTTIDTANAHPLESSRGRATSVKSPPKKYMPLRNDNNSTFSACLLVMDDNHYLMEWLAYHYHTLPLRYLVIAVDSRSRTSPKLVLDRWEEHMTIVRWSDRHFLPTEWQNRAVREDDPTGKLMKHRERQRNFYPACLEFLKRAKREWTTVIDIDEFATQNQHFIHLSKTYPTLLQAVQAQYNQTNTTCISMPRVRFGNYEDGNTTGKSFAPDGFRDSDFLTLRWRWRAGLHSRKENRHPKSIVNVKLISNFSRQDTDAHRPVRSECPRQNLYILNRASPLSVHHYIGTQAQWDFRKDAREGTKTRDQAKFEDYNKVRHDLDESVCGWLKDFTEQHGYSQAKSWLEGVGNVSYTPKKDTMKMN